MEEIGGSHHTVEESGTVDWTWASKTLSKIRTLSLSLTICSVFFFEKADEFVAKKIHRYTEFAAKFMFSVGKVHAVSHSRMCVSVNSTVSLALGWEWRMNNSTSGSSASHPQPQDLSNERERWRKAVVTSVRGKFPGLVFIKRISEHKRGTRHLH